MSKKDFPNLEEQIKHTVKKYVNEKTESTLNSVKMTLKKKAQQVDCKITSEVQNRYKNVNNMIAKNKNSMYISSIPAGRISGIVYIILGITGIGVMSILLIVFLFIGFLSNVKVSSLLFTLLGLNIVLTLRGKSLRKRVKRFNQYASLLSRNNYCSIHKLAIAVGKKEKFVVKDLRKMIDLGMFREAYLNEEKTYFMLGNEVYENYLKLQENLKKHKQQELKKEQERKSIKDPQNQELIRTTEIVKKYTEQIQDINNAISNEQISMKLKKLQDVVSEIINYVEKNPKKLSEVRKFTTQYLPITLKLLNKYKELNDQPVQGDNIKNAKIEIEKSIDVINIAFEKLLDNLFKDVALDVSTDISVLETLFAQEGLTKNDFQK